MVRELDNMDSDSSESQVPPGDGVKEILAPAEGPRENLISTAIKFLQNPKVMSSPLYQKKAFLEKKGLTQEEIELAVQRSGVVEAAAQPGQGSEGSNGVQVYRAGVPPIPGAPALVQPHMAPIPPQSGWAKARDLTMTTVIVASVSYAVYQLFQTYLRPWLLGKSAQERRMERLEEEVKAIHTSVQDSLAQISRTLAAIQSSLTEQQHQSLASQGDLKGLTDIKADISSLKGLMLNKNQFPALPTATPVLPSWQRAPATTTTTATASSTSDSAPTSSLSSSTPSANAAEITSKPTTSATAAASVTANGLGQEEKQEVQSAGSQDAQIDQQQPEQQQNLDSASSTEPTESTDNSANIQATAAEGASMTE